MNNLLKNKKTTAPIKRIKQHHAKIKYLTNNYPIIYQIQAPREINHPMIKLIKLALLVTLNRRRAKNCLGIMERISILRQNHRST